MEESKLRNSQIDPLVVWVNRYSYRFYLHQFLPACIGNREQVLVACIEPMSIIDADTGHVDSSFAALVAALS